MSHGFAFNVRTDLKDFLLINPCGITDKPVTSLACEAPAVLPDLEMIAQEAARLFGEVFRRTVEQVESVDALRRGAEEAARSVVSHPSDDETVRRMGHGNFPAEDRPVEVPREVERLRGDADRPVRA